MTQNTIKILTKQFSSLSKYPLNLWKRSIDVNLTGAFILSQVVSEYFFKVNKGHLINIGSNYGLVAPDQSIYKNKIKVFLNLRIMLYVNLVSWV